MPEFGGVIAVRARQDFAIRRKGELAGPFFVAEAYLRRVTMTGLLLSAFFGGKPLLKPVSSFSLVIGHFRSRRHLRVCVGSFWHGGKLSRDFHDRFLLIVTYFAHRHLNAAPNSCGYLARGVFQALLTVALLTGSNPPPVLSI